MFLVVEIQKNNGQLSHLVTVHETIREAQSKYHTILAAAAVSGLERHSAAILQDDGHSLFNESYSTGGD